MRRLLIVLALFGLVSVAAPAVAAETPAFGAFRVVKALPAATGAPTITLPAGYSLATGSQYHVTSRAEHYSFITGPRADAVTVTVSWPGVPVAAVINGKNRVPYTGDDPGNDTGTDTVTFRIPVTGATPNSLQSTLQVWSYPSPSTASGIHWRFEHNDPDRVAGVWTTVPWPTAATKAFVNLLVASEAVLQDSGLAAEARRRGHFFSLMGFETNNTLHADNPPHWHLAYYPGLDHSAPRAHVPHFWLDNTGRTFYNGMDVQGEGRSRFYAGDPAPIEDAQHNLIVTLTIRADGGLDIEPPGGPKYEITAPGGRFTDRVDIIRGGKPWRWYSGVDHVDDGFLVTLAGSLDATRPYKRTTIYDYDPLTGVIQHVTRS
jgi:hypothetical protein